MNIDTDPYTRPLRFGFVGLGNMGRTHAKKLHGLGHAIVAGADVNPRVRARFADEYGVKTYADHEELCTTDIDAVVVATPNKLHEAAAVAALEAGLDVFIEKPLAHTLESAEQIGRTARASPGLCLVGFHNRFWNGISALISHRDNDSLGRITHVEANYVRQWDVSEQKPWMADEELAGGGALIDIGSHMVDLALYCLGFPEILEVSGMTHSYATAEGRVEAAEREVSTPAGAPRATVENAANVFLHLAGDRTVSIDVAQAANRPANTEVVLHGTDASARFPLGGETVTIHETTGIDAVATERDVGENDPYRAQAHLFASAVRRGESPELNTIKQALTVQRVIDGVYRSYSPTKRIQEL